MRIALFGNSLNKNALPAVQYLVNSLDKRRISLVVHHAYFDLIKESIKFEKEPVLFRSSDNLKELADILFSVGGDGTMLSTIRHVKNTGIPVIGLNTGRLGFLSGISKDKIDEALDAIEKNEYSIESRSLLRLNANIPLFGEHNYALNELTVVKTASASMITIHTHIDGEFLNSYWADGLIISTPTGSTAYSLSCGGPIVAPESQTFVITPIAPHNLNVRPMIIPDSKTITLKVEGRNNSFLVSLDSRSMPIDNTIELNIAKESFCFHLVKLKTQNFYGTIRNKLSWGVDKRN